MKKIITLLVFIVALPGLKAQFVTIPDADFANWLQTNIPSAMIGNQMDTTSLAVTTTTDVNVSSLGIMDLTGIKYFDSLKSLQCSYNNLTIVPPLPNTLKNLDCSNNLFITSLGILPSILEYLECSSNSLTTLPFLPSTLISLRCCSNNLTSLPTLPNSLKVLDCFHNSIINLPALPSTLDSLNCTNNQLSSLPTLPGSLDALDCSGNQLTGLPALPSNLTTLYCIGCQLTTLPVLPASLITFRCDNNQLTSVPTLPNSLTHFFSTYNQLTTLPTLPNSLIYFDCSYNQITSLPSISNSVEIIMCTNNLLTALPSLPNSLNHLFCDYNQLSNLPALPISLLTLECAYNQLTNLPVLPNFLDDLKCNDNNITCFYPFPAVSLFDISNNPFTCLPNYIPSMNATTLTYPLCLAGNVNGCDIAQGIVGFTYKDNNSNCLKDISDSGIRNVPLKIYDSGNNLLGQTYSALNGIYSFPQILNTYKVAVDTSNLPFNVVCSNPGIDSTLTVSMLDTNVHFSFTCKPGYDVGIQAAFARGNVFPGEVHTMNVFAGDMNQWFNLNCGSGISGTLTFSVNGPVTYIGPAINSLTPAVSGNMYTYTIADFGIINNASDFSLIFKTDTTAQMNDPICVTATVTPIGDNIPSNNTYNFCYNVGNSLDPNIKEVYPIDVLPGYNDWLTYTIHFQNTGNAPAINIRLADTLDTQLDLSTFQVINYSHPTLVDLTGNLLTVRFPNIQLPDSTTDLAGSIGYIQYRVKPKMSWVAPYKIKNTAYIYFDYNAPIVTNTTYNSIITTTGIHNSSESLVTLYPNPTNGTFTIESGNKEKQLIQIFDMTGNTVLSQAIENGKTTIDANHLAVGIYNIYLKGVNAVTNKKLVIVR